MSTEHDDGGRAFPQISSREVGENGEYRTEVYSFGGMSLRDYFAAKALEGFCASPHSNIEWLREHCVTSCYQMADAMLKARKA